MIAWQSTQKIERQRERERDRQIETSRKGKIYIDRKGGILREGKEMKYQIQLSVWLQNILQIKFTV